MFRSKPIGWITAGTLFCVAGVALACRLRDGKEMMAEANAAACPGAIDAKEEKSEPAKPIAEPKKSDKKEKETPPSPPADESLGKKPAVGEMVTPVVTVADAKEKEPTEKKESSASPSPVTPPSPGASPVSAPPPPAAAPVPEAPKTADPGPGAPPMANLLSPELAAGATAVRPVSGSDMDKPGPLPTTPPSAPAKEEKWEPVKNDHGKKEVTEASGPPSPAPSATADTPPATIPTKDEKSTGVGTSPPAPTDPGVPHSAVSPPPATGSTAPVPTVPPMTATSPVPPPDRPCTPPASPNRPLYKVRGQGESLRDIARRTLGNGDRWAEIYQLNPELQAHIIVPSGKEIRLPADAKVEPPTEGSQGESEQAGSKPSVTAVRPLPVVRSRQPRASTKTLAPLTGTFSCPLQDHSLVLPKEAAGQLGKVETMLLTPGPDRCLWLGTQASVARVLEHVEKTGASDREVQTFRRLYFAQTEKVTVNDSGKVVIPEKLAEYAGLGKEAVLVGIDDHFELWDAERWQHYSQQKESSLKP